jgi:hypothetical protein
MNAVFELKLHRGELSDRLRTLDQRLAAIGFACFGLASVIGHQTELAGIEALIDDARELTNKITRDLT